jgi:hypothetical protein
MVCLYEWQTKGIRDSPARLLEDRCEKEREIKLKEGGTPPMKMDRCQSKGVAGGAFCKRLKRKGMDGGKKRIGKEGDRRVTGKIRIGGAGKRRFGAQCKQTRERIAENTRRVNYFIGTVRMGCGKLSERKSRQDRINTRTLENPQGMRHPRLVSARNVCAARQREVSRCVGAPDQVPEKLGAGGTCSAPTPKRAPAKRRGLEYCAERR